MPDFCSNGGGGGGGGAAGGVTKIRADANPYMSGKITFISGTGIVLTEDPVTKEITVSAAGGSVNKVTWASGIEDYVDGAVETVVPEMQWLVNFDDAGAGGNVQFRFTAFGKASSGTATFNVRVGGTRGAADGSIVATFSTVAAAYTALTNLGAAFANPGGAQIVKVCLVNSGAGRSSIQGASFAVG